MVVVVVSDVQSMMMECSRRCIVALGTSQAAELQQWQWHHYFFTSGPVRCEAALYGCGTSPVCLVYAIATVFQLYRGYDMIYEMRRKPEPTLLLTQGIFNLPHHIGMV